MKLKLILFFTLTIVLNISSQVKGQKTATIHKKLLKKIKGNWQVVGGNIRGMNIDCENIEASFLKGLKKDSLSNKKKITKFCNETKQFRFMISDKFFILRKDFLNPTKNDTLHLKTNSKLQKNVIKVDGFGQSEKINIEMIDKNALKFINIEKEEWIKLKRSKD